MIIKSDENGKHHMATTLLASGRKTDSALTDKLITVASGFSYVSVVNEGSTELTIAIDESAAAPTKPIFIPAGTAYSDYIFGTTLHYVGAATTTNFRYSIR